MVVKYLLLLFVVFSSNTYETIACGLFNYKYTVYVVNNLPSNSAPLLLHCASGNDDLGDHVLSTNQDFHFDFCENPFSTLFFCRFRWNGKNTAFDVFDASWKKNRCTYDVCYYSVQSDGFYFSDTNPPTNLVKLSSW
ncbi:hypothetical protein ABFX02_06G170500 [Erythranthe guttata]